MTERDEPINVPFDKFADHFRMRSNEVALDSVHATMSLEKQLLGDMRYEPIKKGAMVISVDGESDDKSAQMSFEKISYLGRFIGMKQVNPYFYRIYFTTRDGFFESRNTKVERLRKIQHPLSKKGFLIPSRSGFRIFDKGSILVVSRIGIFDQIEGYKQANEHLRQLVKEKQRSDHYQNLHEESVIKLETMTEELHDTYLRNVSMGEQVRTLMNVKAELTKQREVAEGMAKNMKSKTEMSADVLEHQRRLLEEELSKFNRYVSDVLLTIERSELEDSYRAGRSTHPVLRREFETSMVDKWHKDGIIKDNEAEMLKRRLTKMETALKEAEERDANEEISGHAKESVDRDVQTSERNRVPDGSKGLEKTGGKGGGTGGDNVLSSAVSKVRKGASQAFNELNRVRDRTQRETSDQEADNQAEEATQDD